MLALAYLSLIVPGVLATIPGAAGSPEIPASSNPLDLPNIPGTTTLPDNSPTSDYIPVPANAAPPNNNPAPANPPLPDNPAVPAHPVVPIVPPSTDNVAVPVNPPPSPPDIPIAPGDPVPPSDNVALPVNRLTSSPVIPADKPPVRPPKIKNPDPPTLNNTRDDKDLFSFVTMPHVRAAKFNVTYYDREAVSPGYWFVAPYFKNGAEPPTNRWTPCQIGPHIYDADGGLVWTGSCLFDNRNVFDFRAVDKLGEEPHLSFLVQKSWGMAGGDNGFGVVLDNHYRPTNFANATNGIQDFNMHEFYIYNNQTVLACAHREEMRSLKDLGRPTESRSIQTGGFLEIDLESGEILYEWNSRDAITLDESYVVDSIDDAPLTPAIDYLHVNAIDKNANGDYLLSARHTSTIYLISGQDGHIIWRLGGKRNDFSMDFKFSKQHDARFMSVNDTHMIISFLDNGADNLELDSEIGSEDAITSSALYVLLDTVHMTASVLNRYMRPDGDLSKLRGNMQTLPNGNVFVSWSRTGCQSEFSHDGRLLMEASFAAERFSTYRAYKFPFRAIPTEPPLVAASVYGTSEVDLTTVFHVSWNGATEVATWRFFAQANETSPPFLIGNETKTGFETTFIAHGYFDWVCAEAVDSSNKSLGFSDVTRSALPSHWEVAGVENEESAASHNSWRAYIPELGSNPISIFVLGFICAIICRVLLRVFMRLRRCCKYGRLEQKNIAAEKYGLLASHESDSAEDFRADYSGSNLPDPRHFA